MSDSIHEWLSNIWENMAIDDSVTIESKVSRFRPFKLMRLTAKPIYQCCGDTDIHNTYTYQLLFCLDNDFRQIRHLPLDQSHG